jgi:hypothetical protein
MGILTAVLLLALDPPGITIDHQDPASRQYIGSPSILKLPGGDLLATHDLFGPGSGQRTSAETRVFVSRDQGRTWAKTAEFREQFWSNLFWHRGRVYLMGTSYEYGRIVIRESRDKGRTWSAANYLTEDRGYHTAPMQIIRRKGRLWRSFEWHPEGPWGFFQVFVMSAPEKADLLDAKSWTRTPRLAFPADLPPTEGKHWLETNLVETPDGRLQAMLRVDNVERAAVVRVDEAAAMKGEAALAFEKTIAYPGGAKKFLIRFDKKSRRYWALATPARPEFAMTQKSPAATRNTLVLLSSADLAAWREERVIVAHPDAERHGFQYPDWHFDGRDIIAAVRTAWVTETSRPPRAHDANFLTFHRIADFRRALKR